MKRIYFIALATAFICASAVSSATAQQATPYEVESRTPGNYKDFRFAIGGGYAYRLGKIAKTGDSKIDDMNKKLRHGFTIDADAQYFFKESWGLGLNANYCSANTSGDNITITLPGIDRSVNYKETQSFLYVGPSFVGRNGSEKFLLATHFGFGAEILDKVTVGAGFRPRSIVFSTVPAPRGQPPCGRPGSRIQS